MKSLDDNYSATVEKYDKDTWHTLISLFEETVLYNTWSYGAIRWGEDQLSHLILRKNSRIVAAAQLRILILQGLKIGIAYLTWGPLWILKNDIVEKENFRNILRALYNEYAVKRNLLLRVQPNIIKNDSNAYLENILKQEGYKKQTKIKEYHSFLVDVSPSLETLRKNLNRKWRGHLNKSERCNLIISEGTNIELFDLFDSVYSNLKKRKHFKGLNYAEYKKIQSDLPEELKMKIYVAFHQNKVASILIWSGIGNTAITIFSGTSTEGKQLSGSYLLRWRLVEELKKRNFRYLDQGGIDKERNSGSYIFKSGMGGEEIIHIGRFHSSTSNVKEFIIVFAERMINLIKSFVVLIHRFLYKAR